MRKLIVFLFFIPTILAHCSESRNIYQASSNKIDTVQGDFFIEANVPYKCFTRFGQIERNGVLIPFDSVIKSSAPDFLYNQSIFLFENYPVLNDYANERHIDLSQDKETIKKFQSQTNYFSHMDDFDYLSNLFFDKDSIVSYKKVSAKLIVINVGKLNQLVPNTKNYKCCYSCKLKTINSFFIKKVISFKVY